jgi:hypothetical protein
MKRWYQVALFNLFILACLGFILRYKINFPLEFLEQKKMLHAHSHFAFNGWVSFLLQLIILDNFTNSYSKSMKFWNRFFTLSTIVNYAMIISFALQGYSALSIIISTAALILSYVFTYKIYRNIGGACKTYISTRFILTALFFLVLSSLGPYALAYITVSKNVHQYYYHNALYFFLHFQYNGWFMFAVLGFLMRKIEQSKLYNYKHARWLFLLLATTCIPAYFLTALWHDTPAIVTIINVITAVASLAALYFLYLLLAKCMKTIFNQMPVYCKWLYGISIAAFILKTLLQCFSAHPQLGQMAFAFRPIIIGYLHLIFLIFVSLYLVGMLAEKGVINLSFAITRIGIIVFTSAVILNELLLAIQGFASIYYIYTPAVNILLFVNTGFIIVGAYLLFAASRKKYGPLQNLNL